MTYIFILTFVCFPALVSDTRYGFLSGIKNYASWFNIIVQFEFNFWDTIGRYCGGLACMIVHRKSVVIMGLLRTVFFGTFLLASF